MRSGRYRILPVRSLLRLPADRQSYPVGWYRNRNGYRHGYRDDHRIRAAASDGQADGLD